MNIQMNSLTSHALFFFSESILPTMTTQLKKILVIASIALGCLAACYIAFRCCLFTTKQEDEGSPSSDNLVKQMEVKADDQLLIAQEIDESKETHSPKKEKHEKQQSQKNVEPPVKNELKSTVSDLQGKLFSFSSKTIIAGIEIPHHHEALEITLLHFREMTPEEQQSTIDKFQLQSDIDAIGQAAFFQKLSEVNEKVLGLATLVDLKLNIKTSKLKYILLNDDEFKAVTLRELEKASESQIEVVYHRRNLIVPEPFDLPEDILDLSIIYFHHLGTDTLNDFIAKIPPSIFHFLSDTQIVDLNISQASEEQIHNLFSMMNGSKEDKRRFALLSTSQVNSILGKLNNYQMYLLSDEHLKHLDGSKLNESNLQLLFSNKNGTKEDLQRFALLSSDQVYANLDKLNTYQMYLLSDEHLKHLDVSKLDEGHLQLLFCNRAGTKEDMRRFALLSPEQVNTILEKLNNYQMYLLSDEHLKNLDLSKLNESLLQLLFSNKNGIKEDTRRFALLLPDQVNTILDKLNNYQMYLLSDEHLQKSDLSKLKLDHLELLFSNKNGIKEDLRRFALLSPDQVNTILDKLNNYQMYLLSDEHLKNLDLSKLKENQLELLFSNKNGIKEDLRRFALLSPDQVNTILDKLNNYQMYLLSDEHLKNLDLSKLKKNHLERLFSNKNGTKEDMRRFVLLPAGQMRLIFDKLNDYQLTLIPKKSV